MKIRSKILLTVLPVNLLFLLFLGFGSYLLASSGISRLVMRNLSFKADQLINYSDSQWQLIKRFGYESEESFQRAATLSVFSYAESLLRSPSEVIALIPESGAYIATRIPGISRIEVADDELLSLSPGSEIQYFSWRGDEQVGFVRRYTPAGWNILIFDSRDALFSEVDQITSRMWIILAAATLLSSLLLSWISARLMLPLRQVSRGILQIIETNRFDRRVEVISGDEIGDLAKRFNVMSAALDHSFGRVGDIAVNEAAARIEVSRRELEILQILGRTAEYKDQETGTHIHRVGMVSRMLAEALGEDEASQQLIYFAAPLHDIGKIGIPDELLLKQGKLTPQEWREMQSHTQIGHAILKDSESPYLAQGAIIALNHHEHWDGSGYPNGKRGDEIPLYARILAVADVFDALISQRPYKHAWSPEQARRLILQSKGSHFQPEIADAFEGLFQRICRMFQLDSAARSDIKDALN